MKTPSDPMALVLAPAQRRLIDQSHARCRDLGLDVRRTPDFGGPGMGDWRLVLERSEVLRRLAMPVMTLLHRQIARSRSIVVLTNSNGRILETVGDPGFLERAEKVALSAGVDWSEAGKGTNAIGTALVEQRPTLVHADQHYLRVNHFLTCSAVPLRNPDGTIAGVLDVTGHQSSYLQHTMALIDLSAVMIENRLVCEAPKAIVCVSFHGRPDLLATQAEALACFDAQGRLVASNAAARREYGVTIRQPFARTSLELLGLSLERLVDHGRQRAAEPLRLHLGADTAVFARVRIIERPSVQVAQTQGARVDPAQASAPRKAAVPDALASLDLGDASIRSVIARLRRVADDPLPLVLIGATGTGKKTLARCLHQVSSWRGLPFKIVHCSSSGDEWLSLIEPAAPAVDVPALPARPVARKGTLLLDGVGDMAPTAQARLLGWLADGPQVGGWRLVCTSQHSLTEPVDGGRLRVDLYYRLNGLCLHLPRLAERTDFEAIVARMLEQMAIDPLRLSAGFRECLQACRWPGNLRQLSQLLRSAALLAGPGGSIGPEHLADDFRLSVSAGAEPGAVPMPLSDRVSPDLRQLTDATIRQVLARHGGNVSRCARELGVSRNTVYRRLRAGEASE